MRSHTNRVTKWLLICFFYYLGGRMVEIAFYFRLLDQNSFVGVTLNIFFAPVFYIKSVLYNLGIPG
jgi:hypothetical protein